ncbi:unnamed protein product, partial [Meganyctiphanes norvegica]
DIFGGSKEGRFNGNSNSGGFGGGFGQISTSYNDNIPSEGDFGVTDGGNIGSDIGGGFESSLGGDFGNSIGSNFEGNFVSDGGNFGGAVISDNSKGSVDVSGGFSGGNSGSIGINGGSCSNGQVRHVDGSCVTPMVSRNIFVFAAPEQQPSYRGPAPELPTPKVEYNIVFVRTPEGASGVEPIVVPPPQQKTLVYVLSKNQEIAGQRVIEVPAGPAQQPEVYYVNYDEGENPTLPGGVDLQTALSSTGQIGQVVDGGSSAVGGGHFDGSVGRFEGGDSSSNVGTTGGTSFGSDLNLSAGIGADGDSGSFSHTDAGGNLGSSINGFGDGTVNTPSQLYTAA